jgi:protein-arginine deiminase
MDSLDSFGNLETIPPYSHGGKSYPMGRIIMGKTQSYYPDPTVTQMLESQQVQPPVWVDTSWLSVGHVDETISFVKASAPRGWMLVLNDPALAKQMLEDASAAGHGAVTMFEGMKWYPYWGPPVSAAKTIDEVLADTEVMAESAKAAVEVAAQLAQLKQETGITDAEIIRVPFLHYPVDGYSAAYQPGTANSTVLADGHFAAPDPHGPVIDGVDIFKKQLIDAFAKHNITVHFVENWDLYHALGGEVHCGTNALRATPMNTKWWETGR